METLAPFEVDRSAVPGAIVQRLSIAMSQLAALGFREPIWHVIADDVQQVETYLATMVHESGRQWARVHNRVWHVRSPAKSSLFCELVSELPDGRFVWSLSTKPDLAAPPSCIVARAVGAAPSKLLEVHQAALLEAGAATVRPVTTPEELRASIERHHAEVRGFHVERGLFAPLTADDRETAVAFRDSVQSATGVGSRYPEILAEVDRLQNEKSSRTNGILLLLVSCALFLGAGLTDIGGFGFTPGVLLILVVVLFFHEMGHWVAMRVFGYRNLKMFFIPLFGAAVSGRHYNVPGWKKAIVSLMGPLPGIIVGAGLGWLGVTLDDPLLVKISLITLVLNGFNLLPILPLDGGWIVHAILFSRHHLLELAFRVSALAALFGMAIFARDNILIGLAVVMSLGLPSMYKVARITSELRKEKLPPASEDGQTVPQATADVIVARVKSAFPATLANRSVAQYTIQVFENLNARPPGVLASIGLGALQFGSLAAVAVASTMLFMGARDAEWHALDARSVAVVRAAEGSTASRPRTTVFADLSSSDPAAAGELGALLGSRPLVNGRPAATAPDLSATGHAQVEELDVSMPMLRFANAFDGPLALAQWLLANGCSDLRYTVSSVGDEED